MWVAMYESGVHATIGGVVLGLLVSAYPPRRAEVERAGSLARAFRQSPEPGLARQAKLSVERAVSPERADRRRPRPVEQLPRRPRVRAGQRGRADRRRACWTGRSPRRSPSASSSASSSASCSASGWPPRSPSGCGSASLPPGVSLGSVWSGRGADRAGLHRLPVRHRPRVRRRARCGRRRRSASSPPPWSPRRSARCSSGCWAGGGSAAPRPTRLDPPVDPAVDHLRGPADAPLTLVEFGDMECPFCGRATGVVAELRARFGDELRYVFRHLPLSEVHPQRPARGRGRRGGRRAGRLLGHARPAVRPPGRARGRPTCSTTRPPSGSTSSGSPASWATAPTGSASGTTSPRAEASGVAAAPPPSSSTACGTRARPRPTRWPPRSCAPIRGARRPSAPAAGGPPPRPRSAAGARCRRRPGCPPSTGLAETPDEYGASPRLDDRQLAVLRRAGPPADDGDR